MDPRQTLIDLLESIAARDYDGAETALDNINEWLRKGGYVPSAIHNALEAVRWQDPDPVA